jgi:hypothetical protein
VSRVYGFILLGAGVLALALGVTSITVMLIGAVL